MKTADGFAFWSRLSSIRRESTLTTEIYRHFNGINEENIGQAVKIVFLEGAIGASCG
jgi:hypothetical protein